MVEPTSSHPPQRVNLREIFLGLQTQMIAKLATARKSIPHPGTKGDVSESSWLQMLDTYLPKRYAVEKAIVLDCDGALSDALDIVVFDRHFSPFLFHQEGVCYIPAESVYAVFEVKQDASKENVEYAATKAASVRKLKRTSAPITHAGGSFDPVVPKEILAGLLTLTSVWHPAVGDPFVSLLKSFSAEKRLNLGCVLEGGAFDLVINDHGEAHVEVFPQEQALIQFFLSLLTKFQRIGSVPAMDIRSYAASLAPKQAVASSEDSQPPN